LFNIEDFYRYQSETFPDERFLSNKERALFVATSIARSKVLAVWKAFESVKAVAKLSPSSNFMPWTRLFFASLVKQKWNFDYMKQVTVQLFELVGSFLMYI
jgi:hypothetical protein